MKFTANEKLDSILMALHKQPLLLNLDEIANILSAKYNLYDFKELQQALKRLEKDGYIESMMQNHININTRESYLELHYQITFDGKVFIEDGGYVTNSQLKNLQKIQADEYKSLQMHLQRKMNRLTWWIAFGTLVAAAYSVIQIWQFFFC